MPFRRSSDATATGDQTIEVAIYRQNAQGDFTVELTPTIPEDAAAFFDVPKTAEFKNGQYSVMIPVTVYNVENLAKGATYSVKIAVANGGSLEDSNLAIKSKYAETTVSTALALQWEPLYILSDPTKLLSTDLTEADYVKGADGKPIAQTADYSYNGYWVGDDNSVVIERAADRIPHDQLGRGNLQRDLHDQSRQEGHHRGQGVQCRDRFAAAGC